ncbi:MAG: glycosyltransferase [Gemmatimonadetes bacterium]|nr:glycosyltransferase [Gemmatimonadota bacterium]
MRVAIVHDWLNQSGGAERVLAAIHRLYPTASVFPIVYDAERAPAEMRAWDIRPSFLQRIPLARRKHQMFLPLMPLAVEQMDLGEFDLVISTSSACAKGAIPRPGATHVCYCHTPCRYIWDHYHEYTRGLRFRSLIAPVAHWLRMWDQLSAARVDHFVTNSHWVASRIRSYYRRDSEVIYPPVDVDRFVPSTRAPEDFYLVVSRFVTYKRIDLAIEAANRLGRRLVVVGDGPNRRRLQAQAGPTVEFLGWRSDEEVASLYARCRAFIFPGWEDFGIAPVEAQAAGRPVIAYGRGGALETVVDGVTGVCFPEQTVDSLIAAIERFERLELDPAQCRSQAERFDTREFERRFKAAVDQQLGRTAEAVTVAREPLIRLA